MRKSFRYAFAGALAAMLAFAAPASAQQQRLKIGFITTMSGPQGIIGKHMRDSVELALDHLDRKVGGLPTEVVYGDDQFKPDVGVSPLAGSQCNELYFSASWNNDQSPEAMGKHLQDIGVKELYVMAPNYQAGKDMVAGLKRYS